MNVPQDLISTIQYRLVHPEEKKQPPKTKVTKKQIVAGITVVILTIVLVLGIGYFKKRRNSLNRGDAPIVRTEIIRTFESSKDSEVENLLRKLEAIAEKLGVSGKDNTTEGKAGKEIPED